MEETKRIILFSALDWGLGHTTRSIPLLTYFNEKGYQLLIAAQPRSASEKILQRHFPDAIFLPLKGYCITYAKKRKFFALKIFFQIPKILNAIRRERLFVKKTVQSYPIQLILSDNRYGFYHKSVHSVFMTHQLRIAAPFKWLADLLQRINYSHIEHFNELWIPDLADDPNLGGLLSHPKKMPRIPAQYIGPLSRLSIIPDSHNQNKADPPAQTPFKYLFLLSGPEPQRSILEKRLLETAHKLPGQSILVRGLPAESSGPAIPNTAVQPIQGTSAAALKQPALTVIPYADPETLHELLQAAQYVVCRSGYSTVMDLLIMGKKGIYIPTPGQTEQQYLGQRLMEQGWGFSFEQEAADYADQLKKAEHFSFRLPDLDKIDKAQQAYKREFNKL